MSAGKGDTPSRAKKSIKKNRNHGFDIFNIPLSGTTKPIILSYGIKWYPLSEKILRDMETLYKK